MANPLRMSEAAALALHAAALISGHEGEPLTAGDIAERLGASKAHLSKVLARLSRAGLLHSATGPGGGFTLARPAERISLRGVYEAAEGPLEVTKCMFALPVCEPATCPLAKLLCDASERIVTALDKTTLADFRVSAKAGQRED